jgi:hypothetical protein
MRTEGIEMTGFEKELRYMLTDSEVALLDRYLANSPARDGGIASLVAKTLHRMKETGEMDLIYPEAK